VRAFVIEGPRAASVHEVEAPTAAAGEVVVDVARVGVCGTDVELFTGEMAYLQTGDASYPLRIGHEWCGTVRSAGAGVDDAWIGRHVMGDTMLGCGRCGRCRGGRQHLCADRYEVGIRRGWPGALAEQLAVPATSLHALPEPVDDATGALVEPGGNAWRAVEATGVAAGERLLVLGAGTIGLLVALMARARGVEVHLVARREGTVGFARSLGFEHVWRPDALPATTFDGVVDASNAVDLPALAIDLVEPGGRVVWIGLAGQPSPVDSRRVVLKDVTVVGILSGSPGLEGALALYASGAVDPTPLVAAVVGLDGVAGVLAGRRDPAWGDAPKVHVDPRR
jgi:2-desacetyl-2-hydroxyethyl bacteriochlorophyllide A dehydrogenase